MCTSNLSLINNRLVWHSALLFNIKADTVWQWWPRCTDHSVLSVQSHPQQTGSCAVHGSTAWTFSPNHLLSLLTNHTSHGNTTARLLSLPLLILLEHHDVKSTSTLPYIAVAIFKLVHPSDHRMMPWKFCDDISNGSGVTVWTDKDKDKQTDTQTDTT